MGNAISEIDEQTYLTGFMLWEAIFEFGSPELIDAYDTPGQITRTEPEIEFRQAIHTFLLNLQEAQNSKDRRELLLSELKQHILDEIKKGNLIPFGFKYPRNIQDKPIKIPADLFFSGEIDWDNSELKFRDIEFSGIRLLRDLMPVIDMKPENNSILISKSKKPENINFSDFNPQMHVDEKEAEKLLGISHRTLQGYRIKGGGPIFTKIGKKAVRYKIQDLQDWMNNQKKKNTSEY